MKHVQTEIPEGLYESLHRVALQRGYSIKEATRKAIESYVQNAEDSTQDPLFDFIGQGNLEEGKWSKRKGWRTAGGP